MERRKNPTKTFDRLARLKKIFPHGPVIGDISEVIDIERGNT